VVSVADWFSFRRSRGENELYTVWCLSVQEVAASCHSHRWQLMGYSCCVWSRVMQIRGYVMATLRSRCGHYIFALWFLLLLSSFFFFPRLISAVTDWMSTMHTWCGLSANLGCRSETCYMRLAENTVRKKIAKNSPLIRSGQLCWPFCCKLSTQYNTIQFEHLFYTVKQSLFFTVANNIVQFELRDKHNYETKTMFKSVVLYDV